MAEQPSQSDAAEDQPEARADDSAEQPAEAMAEDALQSASDAAEKIKSHALGSDAEDAPAAAGQPLQLEDLASSAAPADLAAGLNLLDDIDLTVRIELGRTLMYVEDILRLNENSVVELDKAAGDPVDIFVNDRHVARGEVLVLNENFCVRISEIIKQADEDEEPGAKNPGSAREAQAA